MKNLTILILLVLFSCGTGSPKFDEDNAFKYLLTQCEFGPRNPGSEGYYACLNFMIEELSNFADEIILQDFDYQEQKYGNKYDLQNEFPSILTIDKATAQFLETTNEKQEFILLGTTATTNTSFYYESFKKHGLKLSKPSDSFQLEISKSILEIGAAT